MLAAGNPTHLQQHAMPVSSATAFGHGVVPFVMPGWEGRRHGGNHHLMFLNTSPRVGGPRHSGRGYVSEQCASARMQCADIQRQSAAWYVSFSMLSPHRACLCIVEGWACVFVQHRLCWCKWEALVCSGMGDRVDR